MDHPGFPAETKTLRLGNIQTRTFVAGVASTPIVGNTVLIDANGQLGTLVSSARYKQDLHSLGDQQQKLQQLRPVTFHYKQEPRDPLQYGLIAEEVAQIYPELVTKDATGKIKGVRYEELTPILLYELQCQHRQLEAQAHELEQMHAVAQQVAELRAQNEALRAAVAELQEREGKGIAVAAEAIHGR